MLTPTPLSHFERNVTTHTSSFSEILWSSGDGWRERRGRWEFVQCPASGESDLNHKRLLLIFCFKHYAFQQFLCLFAILREDCHEMNLKGIFEIKAQKTFLWGWELSLSGGDEGGLIAFEWIIKGSGGQTAFMGVNFKLRISLTFYALHSDRSTYQGCISPSHKVNSVLGILDEIRDANTFVCSLLWHFPFYWAWNNLKLRALKVHLPNSDH